MEWLTSSSAAGVGEEVGIRRAVLAVVAQEKEDICTVVEKSINQFGDQLYIKHSPMLQQEGRMTRALDKNGGIADKTQHMPRSCSSAQDMCTEKLQSNLPCS